MAKIKRFVAVTKTAGPHPTEVECGYQVITSDEGVLLQLSTYGSDDRQTHKKTSQTIQIDHERAAELLQIITNTFPGLGK